MVDNYVLVADAYETRLEELEDLSLDPSVDESLLTQAAALRRQLLELRRLATSQRELLTPLAKGEYEHVSEALEQRFSHVEDHLMHATELIDGLAAQIGQMPDRGGPIQEITARSGDASKDLLEHVRGLLLSSILA